jgi:hypothetical protein
MKYLSISIIDSWINSHEEFIRHWAAINNYKIWKEAKEPFHLGIQKKTQNGIYKKTGQPFYNYGPIQKIKITFQKQIYLKPYMKNCDILWWIRDKKITVIDMEKLKNTNHIEYEDNFGETVFWDLNLKDKFDNNIFSPEQVNCATIQVLDTSEKINFTCKKSFSNYKLSYFTIKQHYKAWIITITKNEETGLFHGNYLNWDDYSKAHGNCKNIQLKRNEEAFKKAISGTISKKAHFKQVKEFSFYTENEDFIRPGWLYTCLQRSSVLDLLNILFPVQALACNLVNNISIVKYRKDSAINTTKSITYKVTSKMLVSKIRNDNTKESPLEKDNASLIEKYPENYKVFYPPRKDGCNSKKYLEAVKSDMPPPDDFNWEIINKEIQIKESGTDYDITTEETEKGDEIGDETMMNRSLKAQVVRELSEMNQNEIIHIREDIPLDERNELYTEWRKHCESLHNDPERCWTFKEFIELKKGA